MTKLYPMNFKCTLDDAKNTRDTDIQNILPLAKTFVKSLVSKGIEEQELIKLIINQYPILLAGEAYELVIKSLIGIDLKYNDVATKMTEEKIIVK